MDELTISTRQEPGIAELSNFNEIKAYLNVRLDAYRNLAYSEDSLKTAKEDKTALNKLKKALDTRRKEIKAVYMEPYLHVETQIKELITMIDEPLVAIDSFVKGMDEEDKRQKRDLIHSWYEKEATPLGELSEKVFNSPAFFDTKWLNKSCKASEWQAAVKEKISKCTADVASIQAFSGAQTAAVLNRYLEDMDIRAVAEYKRQLEEAARLTEVTVKPVPEEDKIIGYKVLKVYGNQRQMEQLFDQFALLDMEVDELEDGMPKPMTELLTPSFECFVAFDIETSGTFGAANGDAPAEITEIGAVKVLNGQIVETKDWLCNPGRRIVPRIAHLTHITDEIVRNSPPVEAVVREFAEFVGNLPLVGHNIRNSDLHYVSRAAKRAGIAMNNEFFDTYLYAKTLKAAQGWENVKLETLSSIFGVEHPEAHRAWCDAEVNAKVYFFLKSL